jgi:hypothetical protein
VRIKTAILEYLVNLEKPEATNRRTLAEPTAEKIAAERDAYDAWKKFYSEKKPVVEEARDVAAECMRAVADLKEFSKRFKKDEPTRPWDFSLQNLQEQIAVSFFVDSTEPYNALEYEGITPETLHINRYDLQVLRDLKIGRDNTPTGDNIRPLEFNELLWAMYERIQEQKLWFLSIGKPIDKQHPFVTSADLINDGLTTDQIIFQLQHRVKELYWTESKTLSSKLADRWQEADEAGILRAFEAWQKEEEKYELHKSGIKIDKKTREVKQTTARSADVYNEQAHYLGKATKETIAKVRSKHTELKETAESLERASAKLAMAIEARKQKQAALGGGFVEKEAEGTKRKRLEKWQAKRRMEKITRGEIDPALTAGTSAVHTKTSALPVMTETLLKRIASGEQIAFDDAGNEIISPQKDSTPVPPKPAQPNPKRQGSTQPKNSPTNNYIRGSVMPSGDMDFNALQNLLKRPGVDTGRQDNLPHL